MNARKLLARLLVVSAIFLIAYSSATAAPEPAMLPAATDTFSTPYETVWDAILRSLGPPPPVLVDKARGRIESDPFFFYFPFGGRVSQGMLVSLAITVTRVDAHHTTVEVQPRVHFMIYDGVLPGPANNPWTNLFARIRDNLGPSS